MDLCFVFSLCVLCAFVVNRPASARSPIYSPPRRHAGRGFEQRIGYMAKHNVEDIRNVALVGHGAVGKTSLADALLFHAKAVDRHGSVDEGTSVSDFDDEEKKRKFSIDTSVLHLEHKGKQVYLLDTPGYPDFVGGALSAL